MKMIHEIAAQLVAHLQIRQQKRDVVGAIVDGGQLTVVELLQAVAERCSVELVHLKPFSAREDGALELANHHG